MTAARGPGGPGGLVIVDKPGGMTSHDVVARIRRMAGTRRVGHAGTLDPMATGVLVVGVEKATRLLGHLSLADKEYLATIRLGQATDTDDAEGAVIASDSAAGVSEDAVRAAIVPLTGEIQQVPPGISAIKVDGKRAYRLTREGAAPELKARPVTVAAFEITGSPPERGPARRRRGRDLLQRYLCPRPGPRSGGRAGRGRPPDHAAPGPLRALPDRDGADPGRTGRALHGDAAGRRGRGRIPPARPDRGAGPQGRPRRPPARCQPGSRARCGPGRRRGRRPGRRQDAGPPRASATARPRCSAPTAC